MKQLSIRCGEDLARAAKRRAEMRHQSLNDYVLALVEADLALPVLEDWLADLGGDRRVGWKGSSADLVREDRER